MKNKDIDRIFIGALRTHKGPIHIELISQIDTTDYTIPTPDKQLLFEISLAVQNYYRRVER